MAAAGRGSQISHGLNITNNIYKMGLEGSRKRKKESINLQTNTLDTQKNTLKKIKLQKHLINKKHTIRPMDKRK